MRGGKCKAKKKQCKENDYSDSYIGVGIYVVNLGKQWPEYRFPTATLSAWDLRIPK